MSSEPSCTGRWASSYLHQSEYFSCDPLSNYDSYFFKHFSPSTPFPVLLFYLSASIFSMLSLTTFHLPTICIFFSWFPFLLPFYFRALSSVAYPSISNSIYLIPSSNSTSVFSLLMSVLLLSFPCVCLVIRQMSWISKKKYISLDVFFLFFCTEMYF